MPAVAARRPYRMKPRAPRVPEGPIKVAENKLQIDRRLYGVAMTDGSIVMRFGNRLVCAREAKLQTAARTH